MRPSQIISNMANGVFVAESGQSRNRKVPPRNANFSSNRARSLTSDGSRGGENLQMEAIWHAAGRVHSLEFELGCTRNVQYSRDIQNIPHCRSTRRSQKFSEYFDGSLRLQQIAPPLTLPSLLCIVKGGQTSGVNTVLFPKPILV